MATEKKLNVEQRLQVEKNRRFKFHTRLENELLDSAAFEALDYAPAIKVYFWSLQKIRYKAIKERRKKKYIVESPVFSFTYDEANARGMVDKVFKRAITKLVEYGFWDIEKLGTGLHKDYSTFHHSDRWRKFGTENFKKVEYPKRHGFGYCGKKRKR